MGHIPAKCKFAAIVIWHSFRSAFQSSCRGGLIIDTRYVWFNGSSVSVIPRFNHIIDRKGYASIISMA